MRVLIAGHWNGGLTAARGSSSLSSALSTMPAEASLGVPALSPAGSASSTPAVLQEGAASSAGVLREAMCAFADGFCHEAPAWQARLLPFGGGEALAAACEDHPRYRLLTMPVDEPSTRRIGIEVLRAWEDSVIPVIEGGHLDHVDAGFCFLEALSGQTRGDDPLESWFDRAVEAAKMVRAGRELIVAASTRRPLLGPSSTLALLPDLTPRTQVDPRWAAQVMRAYDRQGRGRDTLPLVVSDTSLTSQAGHGLPSVLSGDSCETAPGEGVDTRVSSLAGTSAFSGETHSALSEGATDAGGGLRLVDQNLSGGCARLPGAGAAGGVGAAAFLLGGRLLDTGAFAAQLYDIDTFVEQCDLLVVWEPQLHSPLLAERCLDILTQSAAQYAIPVVACAYETSLSSHERAQWGLHGIVEKRGDSWESFGRRVARTWAR